MTDEFTLDPQDWQAFSKLAHRMVDDMLEHTQSLQNKPAWQPMPAEVCVRLSEPVPFEEQGAESAYRSFVENVLPYPNGNIHPRFFGWVQGNGTPLGMMAEMLAAAINPHMAGFNQAPALVESQVVRWMIELMRFPATSSGVFVGGGMMANIMGLAVARQSRAGFDIRSEGLYGSPQRLTVYGSSETHSWIAKGVELLGLGRKSLRTVPTRSFRLDPDALRRMVTEDRCDGMKPICVVGTAGTVGTGATDNLHALAEVCREEGLWFHIDGAFGALAQWSERLRPRVAGLDEADSLAFDLHKWMYQPFTAACLLVRDAQVHKATFASSAAYLAAAERGVIAGGLPFADMGIELTREFRALKVWMSLKAHGVHQIARVIEQNVDQAEWLANAVRGHPDLELLAPVELNIVCFRFRPTRLGEGELDRVNEELLLRLQERGIAVPSSTIVQGRFAIRCAFVNHRTRQQDLQALVNAVLNIGYSLVGG